jgi:hypothetical protein
MGFCSACICPLAEFLGEWLHVFYELKREGWDILVAPLDRIEMRTVGRNEMQLDPALRPGEPV